MVITQTRRRIVGGVLLAVLLLAFFTVFGGLGIRLLFGIRSFTKTYLILSRFQYWLLLLVLWFYAVRVERQNLLIWPERKYPFWVYILSVVALSLAVWIGLFIATIVILLFHQKTETSLVYSQLIDILKTSPPLVLFTAVTAGVTEELIIRGYLLPRLNYLSKSPLLAIIFTALLFASAHLGYGTVINVVVPFIIGLAQAFYYWRFRNIKVAIIFHILWDLMVIYLAIRRA